MYESHYGKGMNQGDEEYIVPGSSDARSKNGMRMKPESGMSKYGKKVSTKKNTTGSAAPNTGIQGSATRSKSDNTQNRSESVRGTSRTHRSSYGTTMGSQLDNSPTATDAYDYGKGRMKKGDQRRRVKEQGR